MSSSPPRQQAQEVPRASSSSPRSTARKAPRRRAPSSKEGDSGSSGNDTAQRKRDGGGGKGDREERVRAQSLPQSQAALSQPLGAKSPRHGTPILLERRVPPVTAGAGRTGIMPTGLLLRKPTPDLSAATRPDTFGSRLATRPSDRAKSEPTGLEAPSAVRDGQHPASQTGSPSSVHKILDHQQRFQLSEPAHRALSDLPGCFIVGILGCKRVGKSTILSHLASNPSLFSPRTPTTGIDLHVTPERVVLLDTQSLYIGAGPQPRSELVHSIRMATFVMAVCHVILVVGDDAPDQNLMTFLRRVETVRHRLLPIAPREEARDRCPVISYVATKCKGGAFATDNYQAVAHVVSESLKGMRIRMTGGPSLEVAFPYYRASPALEDPSIAPVTSPNVFLLPVAPSVAKHKRITLQDLMIDRGVPARFEMMLKHLRNQVFVTSRTPSAERPGWRAWFGISEREWLKGAARSWEILRKADVAGEWIRAGKG